MATVEDVALRVLSAADVNADQPIGILEVVAFVSDRYAELVGRVRFRHQRKLGVLAVPATITDGQLTATQGSATVVADADAQTAITAAGSIVGRHLRINTVWYEISAYAAPNLTLVTPYSESTNSGTATGYIIAARYLALASDARWLGKFVYMRMRRELRLRAQADLDRVLPERQRISDGPWFFCETANASNGVKRVELYPYSGQAETIHYTYWAIPSVLARTDTLPKEIDPYVLKEGTLIDIYRKRAAQAVNKGDVNAAGFWRNEMRAQMTSWETEIKAAARADRGTDDISWIYHVGGLSLDPMPGDIANANDQVFSSGNRP